RPVPAVAVASPGRRRTRGSVGSLDDVVPRRGGGGSAGVRLHRRERVPVGSRRRGAGGAGAGEAPAPGRRATGELTGKEPRRCLDSTREEPRPPRDVSRAGRTSATARRQSRGKNLGRWARFASKSASNNGAARSTSPTSGLV